MPLTLEQKRKLIAAHGLNPDEYDIDPSEQNIIPLPFKAPDPSGAPETTVDLPKPSANAPGMLESAGRGAAESFLPGAAGLGTTAAALALFPEPTMLTKVGALGLGLISALGASKAQRSLVPTGVQEKLFTRPEDYTTNPLSTIAGGFVGPGAFRPSLQDVPDLIGGIKALPRTLSAGGAALSTPQSSALFNAAANTIPSAGIYASDVMQGNREFNFKEALMETLPGLLMTRTTPIGRGLGFKDAPTTRQLLEAQTGKLEPATPEPTVSTRIAGILPEESLSTVESRAAQERKAVEEIVVPKGRAAIREEIEQNKLIEAETQQQINRSKKLKEADYRRMEAEAELELQKAQAAELEAETLKQQNEQRKVDLSIGGKKGYGTEATPAERLKERIEAPRLAQEELVPEVNIGTELNKAKQSKATQKELESPLTEAEQIQEDYDLGRRTSVESDLPPLNRTPIEGLPEASKRKIKAEIERVARLRRQKVQYVDSLKDKTGKEILGEYDPKSRTFKLNKALYTGDTGPHETSHGRILDLLESSSKQDSNLVLKGLEFADPQGRKFTSVDDYKKLPISEQIAIEERFAKSVGPEGYRRQVQELFGKKRERFTEWLKQIGTHFKVKTGLAGSDELYQHFVERQMFDAPDATRIELAGAKNTIIPKTPVKKEEIKAEEVKKSTESDLPPLEKGSDYDQYISVQKKISEKIKKGEYSDEEFQKLWKENEEIKNRNGGMPPQKPDSGVERQSTESDLPTEDIQQDSNYPAAGPLGRFFSSATKQIRNLGGKTAAHVSDQAEKYFATKSLNEGLYSNSIQAEITSYPKDVRDRVDEYGREMMESKGKNEPFTLDQQEQSLYDSVRDYLLKVADDNTKREIKRNPHYWPAILDTRVASIWSKAPNSPEGRMYQKEWMAHARKQVEEGRAKYTQDELNTLLSNYMAAISSGGREASLEFGALRKAAGLGLPISMQDNNLLSRFGRYGKRVAKDLAFAEAIESDPIMRYMLRLPDEKGVISNDIPNLPDGTLAEDRIRGSEPVQNIEKFMYEEFQGNKHPRIQALSRLINSSLLGTATGVRDFVTSPLNVSTVIGNRNAKELLNGFRDWKQAAEDSFRYGARKLKMNELEFGSAAHPDTLTKWFNEVADGFRKYSGREAAEQASRIYMWNVGKLSALAEFGRAAQGNETSINWLNKHGTTVKDLDKYIGLSGAEIPEDVINRIAKSVVDRAAGTYDARGLPAGVMEGPLAPFFSLSRWSIEKANVVVEDILQPARQGDFIPLLSYTLGSFLTGSAIQQLNQLMSSGKKGSEPTLGEASAADEQQVRAVTNLLQLGSFGGMIGDLMKSATEIYSGHSPRGLSFPLADFVSDNLGKNLTDYFSALQAGEDKTEAALGLIENVITQSVQSLRLLSYATWNNDEIGRKNAYRDYRLWQELTNRRAPEGQITRPNDLIGGPEKEFKRAETVEESVAALPKAIESIIKKAGKNPMEVVKGFQNLKRNSYQTWPTEVPEQIAYYEYLKKTAGEEAATESFGKFLKQRELNKFKNEQLVPSF